jgi:hypothetical protein
MTDFSSKLATRQHIFQRLQAEERLLWNTVLDLTNSEEDSMTAYRHRESFHLLRADLRRSIRREFDLSEVQLRTIEIEGIFQGWPLGDA